MTMETDHKTFNWGIIGLGFIASSFAKGLKSLPNARLLAVASRSRDKAAQFAEMYNVPYFYGNYKDIIKTPGLDAIYIATPHTLHCENTLFFLENHIPVLCEKPFAMNTGEVNKMVGSAKKNNVFLMEALWTRFLPSTLAMLEIIRSEKLGKPLMLRADFGFKPKYEPESRLFNPALGGGSILDVGIYPLFLSLLLFGRPTALKALASLAATGVDESCGMLLQYQQNEMAVLSSSIACETATEAEIYCESGRARIDRMWFMPSTLTITTANGASETLEFEKVGNGYQYEALEVMKCVASGKKESGILPLSFSMQLIGLLDAVRKECGLHYEGID